MPRRRSNQFSHLQGTNIQAQKINGTVYYYYRMPDGSLEPLAHGNEKASVEAAIILNRELRPSGNIVSRILNSPPKPPKAPKPNAKNPPIVDALNEFESQWMMAQQWAERTLREARIKLKKYREHWSIERTGDIDTFAVAQFLKTLSPESARKHRILLDQFFRFVASSGYNTQRPMLDIQKVKSEKRKRARHTWEGHKAIYDASPVWLRRAINTALYSLQRRSDLVNINTKTDIDLGEKTIRILQAKTENYDTPVLIDITMGDELYSTVLESLTSDIPCPFLIHCRPKRITKQSRESKPHPFAVLPEYLTRQYSKIRDEVGVYNHLPKTQRPGIHSLRALGIWLYTKAGYPDDYIMALSGHATLKMKAHYVEGHEKPKPVKVAAGLSLKDVKLENIDWETDFSKPLKKIMDDDSERL